MPGFDRRLLRCRDRRWIPDRVRGGRIRRRASFFDAYRRCPWPRTERTRDSATARRYCAGGPATPGPHCRRRRAASRWVGAARLRDSRAADRQAHQSFIQAAHYRAARCGNPLDQLPAHHRPRAAHWPLRGQRCGQKRAAGDDGPLHERRCHRGRPGRRARPRGEGIRRAHSRAQGPGPRRGHRHAGRSSASDASARRMAGHRDRGVLSRSGLECSAPDGLVDPICPGAAGNRARHRRSPGHQGLSAVGLRTIAAARRACGQWSGGLRPSTRS
jgi:hypothetical protein